MPHVLDQFEADFAGSLLHRKCRLEDAIERCRAGVAYLSTPDLVAGEAASGTVDDFLNEVARITAFLGVSGVSALAPVLSFAPMVSGRWIDREVAALNFARWRTPFLAQARAVLVAPVAGAYVSDAVESDVRFALRFNIPVFELKGF